MKRFRNEIIIDSDPLSQAFISSYTIEYRTFVLKIGLLYRDEAGKRRDNAVECLKFQEEVRDTYKEALDKLDCETQADFKPFIDEIIKKIKEEQPGHPNNIGAKLDQQVREWCTELLDGVSAFASLTSFFRNCCSCASPWSNILIQNERA